MRCIKIFLNPPTLKSCAVMLHFPLINAVVPSKKKCGNVFATSSSTSNQIACSGKRPQSFACSFWALWWNSGVLHKSRPLLGPGTHVAGHATSSTSSYVNPKVHELKSKQFMHRAPAWFPVGFCSVSWSSPAVSLGLCWVVLVV